MAGVNQSTSGGTNETNEGQNALDMDAAEINKFAGESYEDGKVITTQTPKTGKEVAAKPQTPSQKAAATAAAKGAEVDDDDGDDDDTGADKRTPDHKSAQARINIAVGKQRQAERERDASTASFKALEARLAKLEAGGGTPAQQAAAAKVIDPNAEPDPANYDYGEADLKYVRDLARYETRKELGAIKETEKKQELTAAQQQANADATKALDKFFKAGTTKFGENYKEMVSNDDIKITPQLVKLMLDSDNGVDIAFDLASDEKLAAKVSALAGSPDKQAAWFGAYEAQHYSSDTADADEDEDGKEEEIPAAKVASKPVSKAPKPPVHKNRGGGSSEAASASTSDFAAFERMANAKR